jgi:hypothetical protein
LQKECLFFPAVGDAATELIQRETDRQAFLLDHFHDVWREICQLECPGSEGTVLFIIFGDLSYSS